MPVALPARMEIFPPAFFLVEVHDLGFLHNKNTRQDAFAHSCFNTAMALQNTKSCLGNFV